MKRYYFFILAIIAIVAVSCDSTAVISPRIDVMPPLVRTSIAGVKDTIELKDSLTIGDTVQMRLLLNGYYDCLTSFVVSASPAKVQLSLDWPDSLGRVTPDSDPAHAKLYFMHDSVYACLTTLNYVPQDTGLYRITLMLSSSAKQEYSQSARLFYIAVKDTVKE